MFGLLFEHGTRYEYLAVSSAEEPRNRVHVTGRCTPSILPSTPTTIAERRGVLIIKHGHSRMPSHPYNAETEHVACSTISQASDVTMNKLSASDYSHICFV